MSRSLILHPSDFFAQSHFPEICSSVCPYCGAGETFIKKAGRYTRSSDGETIQRFFCRRCSRHFSQATSDPCFRHKKRHLHRDIFERLASGQTQRRIALVKKIARKTVVRKMLFLAAIAERRAYEHNLTFPPAAVVEFDELETAEHTKCKPLSMFAMVEEKTRRILGVAVARMPAKGRLAKISRLRYGERVDERPAVQKRFLETVKPLVCPTGIVKSDMNPFYPSDIKRIFPEATHILFKGRKSRSAGLGELKKGGFDQIFAINHTCAMFRANMSRLFRRSWNLSKKPERLEAHAMIYVAYHNLFLLNHPAKSAS
mgnify:FL=1